MFKIPDDDIMSFVKQSYDKERKKRGLILEQEADEITIDTGCGDIPIFPKLNLTKLIGKRQPTDVDARQYREIVGRVTSAVQGSTVRDRIQSLNTVMKNILEGDTANMEIDTLISRFIFLDSFLSLLSKEAYEPQMAGLLAEPLIASVLKGEQKGGSSVISDFEVPNLEKNLTTGISLKLVGDRKVVGSFRLLLAGLIQYGVIGFYHIQKFDSKEEPGTSSKIAINYYEYQKPSGLEEEVVRVAQQILGRGQAGLQEPKAGDEGYDEMPTNVELTEQEVGDLESLAINYLLKPPSGYDSSQASNYRKQIMDAVLAKFDFSELAVNKEYKINFSVGEAETYIGDIDLPSREGLRLTAEKSINSLNDQVSELYRHIGLLSCAMKNYTAGENVTREQFAERSITHANRIVKAARDIKKGK